jgi:cytochrome P450
LQLPIVHVPLNKIKEILLFEPDILARIIAEKGDTLILKIVTANIFAFANPKFIQSIFDQPALYRRSKKSLGTIHLTFGEQGLVTVQDHDMWKKDRAALNELFSPAAVKNLIKTIVQSTSVELDAWQLSAEQHINIDQRFTKIIIQNALQTLFGGLKLPVDKIASLRELLYVTSPFLYFTRVKLFGLIPVPPLYGTYRREKKILTQLVDEVVKASLAPTVSDSNIIKHLAKAYGFQSYEQLTPEMKTHLHSEAATFLIASYVGTTALVGYTCMYLSLYPNAADKLYAEVKAVLNGREPSHDDLEKLIYTRAFIKEVMRLQPPARVVAREAFANDNIEGIQIKKGNIIYIPIYAAQRHQHYWDNPEGFNPDRFLQPLTKEQQILYMPFGRGERSCIGQYYASLHITIIIVLLAQRYRLELMPGFEFEREADVINRLSREVKMKNTKPPY